MNSKSLLTTVRKNYTHGMVDTVLLPLDSSGRGSLSLSLSLSRSRHTTYLPVGFQEARILAHDIHNVGGNHGLVVLALRRAAHAQQVLNHGDQELLFGLLMLRATDGSDGPAQAVEVVPPFVLVSTAFDQYALLRADRCNVLVKERT